jgi:dTDP-glucose 4,6-dehydratase
MTRDELIGKDLDKILPQIPDDPGLGGAAFFVTGGTGFVGIWLVKALLRLDDARGYGIKITVLSRSPERFAENHPGVFSRVTVLRGDIAGFPYPPGEYRYIIHAATDTGAEASEKSPVRMFDSIVLGTRRVAGFASRCGCRKFLYVSSGAVYGVQPPDIPLMDESYRGAPDSAVPSGGAIYGEGKRAGEMISALFGKEFGFEAKIARPFAFVGPYLPLDAHFAAGNFIGDAISRRDITVRGDGTPYRSYMYPADLALWLLAILLNGAPGRAYNVGSDSPISILELAERVASSMAPPLGVRVVKPQADMLSAKPERPARYVPSVKRARDELGLRFNFSLGEAISATINWHGVA